MSVFIIMKNFEHKQITDAAEPVGVFEGTYEEAESLVLRMNTEDPEISEEFLRYGRVRYGYWKKELDRIDMRNYRLFIPS